MGRIYQELAGSRFGMKSSPWVTSDSDGYCDTVSRTYRNSFKIDKTHILHLDILIRKET